VRRELFVSQDTSNLQNPFIVGERIYLRPLEPARDNHLYSTWVNDEEIRRYFSIYPTSDTRGEERLELLYKDGKHIIFGVALNENNRLIGLVGLKDIKLHQPERGILYNYRRSLRLGQRLWNRSHEIDDTLWFYGIEPQSHPDPEYGR
jgi:hypothetical protein